VDGHAPATGSRAWPNAYGNDIPTTAISSPGTRWSTKTGSMTPYGHAKMQAASCMTNRPATADIVAQSEGATGVLQKIGLELKKTLTAIGDKSGL